MTAIVALVSRATAGPNPAAAYTAVEGDGVQSSCRRLWDRFAEVYLGPPATIRGTRPPLRTAMGRPFAGTVDTPSRSAIGSGMAPANIQDADGAYLIIFPGRHRVAPRTEELPGNFRYLSSVCIGFERQCHDDQMIGSRRASSSRSSVVKRDHLDERQDPRRSIVENSTDTMPPSLWLSSLAASFRPSGLHYLRRL
jgi:hypothetical protein